MLGNGVPEVIMEIVTDSAELAKARAQRERFDRNAAWLQAHAHEVYPKIHVHRRRGAFHGRHGARRYCRRRRCTS
jgi:hypothetical protein